MSRTLMVLLLVLTSLSEAEEFKPLPSEEDWRGSDRALKDVESTPLRANHSVFFPGSFIADTGSDETVQFTQISAKYSF